MFKVPLKVIASITALTAGVAGTAYADEVWMPLFKLQNNPSSANDSHAISVLTAIDNHQPGTGSDFGRAISGVASSNGQAQSGGSQGFLQSGGIGGSGGSHGKR
jgi:uncharacterized membrane protein